MPGNDLSKPAVACYKPMQIEKAMQIDKGEAPQPKRKVQLAFEDDTNEAPKPAIAQCRELLPTLTLCCRAVFCLGGQGIRKKETH